MQRVSEWLETPKMDYHARQLANVYRSTIHFCDWLENIGYVTDKRITIMDLACGPGANLAYMGTRWPHCEFVGIDLNPDFVRQGNKVLKNRRVLNAHIEQGDWYSLGSYHVDGVVSYQTLSWLPEFTMPLKAVCDLNPEWMAHTSLFYDGYVSSTNETQTWDEDGNPQRKLFYNVYSIPVVGKFLKANGYGKFQYAPFEIDIDLPKTGEFRSYTEKTEDGRRIQISGPVLMPWYFIAAEGVR